MTVDDAPDDLTDDMSLAITLLRLMRDATEAPAWGVLGGWWPTDALAGFFELPADRVFVVLLELAFAGHVERVRSDSADSADLWRAYPEGDRS